MNKIIILITSLLLLATTTEARKVSGTVKAGEEKLSGVIVTDGKNFTQTKKNGRFSFEIKDDAEFVYIVTPAGYVADWSSGAPAFYQRAAEKKKFEFDLIPVSESADYSIVAAMDSKVIDDEEFKADLRETLTGLKNYTVGLVAGAVCPENINIPFYPYSGGPLNYAFFMGKDVVLVVDTADGSYGNDAILWTGRLLKMLPSDAGLYLVQSVPMEMGKRKIRGRSDMLAALNGRRFNLISAQGDSCCVKAPKGYKVYTKKAGMLDSYYKSVAHSKDYQSILYVPGETAAHPNGVVLDVWDWNPQWKAEWFEDGKSMGMLKPVKDCYNKFAAAPHADAKTVTIVVENPFGRRWVYNVNLSEYVSVQAHISGLTPKNMEEKVKGLLDMGVNALEFGIYVSPDGDVELARGVPAGDFIDFAEKYAKEKGYSPVRYSVDLKSWKGRGEGYDRATYDNFATDACKLLNSRYLDDRLVVGSRDYRILNYINVKYPELVLSYIVDDEGFDFEKSLKRLKFTPQYLSPAASLVNKELMEKCKAKGLLLAPHGADTPEAIARILSVKPAAIITSSPEEAIMQNRGFVVPKKHY